MLLENSYSRTCRESTLRKLVTFAVIVIFCHGSSTERDAVSLSRKVDEKFRYRADWQGTRRWVGPDWWANPIYDWSLRSGNVISAAARGRTLCLLPVEIVESPGRGFSLKVTITLLSGGLQKNQSLPKETAVGFRLARRGLFDDFRRAVIFPTNRFDAKVDYRGHLILGFRVSSKRIDLYRGSVVLRLRSDVVGTFTKMTLTASQKSVTDIQVSAVVPTKVLNGGIALLSDGPSIAPGSMSQVRFAFRGFSLAGNLVRYFPQRSFGPIVSS